jgi:hypothetical protein
LKSRHGADSSLFRPNRGVNDAPESAGAGIWWITVLIAPARDPPDILLDILLWN